jgi:hypothetical protein
MPDVVQVIIAETEVVQVLVQPSQVVEVVSSGSEGIGVPPGGATGQALVKASDADYVTEWVEITASAVWGGITGTLSNQTDLQTALNAKQATLVSGTNIKTLNGSTILGAGDLVIPTGVAWGGITGTLSAQTDLQAALNLKANTSSLAAIATSGSASDLGAGTLPAARFNDTAHGARAGGTLHADATTSVSGFMSGADKTKLNGIATGATANATDAFLLDRANHTGTQLAATISDFATAVAATPAVTANTAKVTNATHTGDVTGATALTIANDAVSNAKLANMATATIKGRTTAGTGDPEDLTATQATALLDTFTSGAKGLAPASGGGTTNFLRADGTWAAAGGGGGAFDYGRTIAVKQSAFIM